jgi:phenylpropionate dioxygenase-like ring-hydroxylating dioxygenase large terminal subunit
LSDDLEEESMTAVHEPDPVAAGPATLPYAHFTDPLWLPREQEAIFERSWLYVTHTGALQNPGDYVTARVGKVPLVLTCDEDGALHALRNVCCHRGAEAVPAGCGNVKALQCQYHGWTYKLDGRLAGAPRSRTEPGFDKADFALAHARIDTYGPFVFVNLDLEAAPLREALEGIPELVDDTGVELDKLRFGERREYVVEANWKVVVENYLECYHCPVAHPSFADVIDLNTYTIETFGRTSTQIGQPKDADATVDEKVKYGRYNYVWPTFMLNIYPGPGNVSTNLIVPLGVDRTLAVYDFFYEEGADQSAADEITELVHQVMVEDIGLCESVQRGMSSETFSAGRLMLRYEHSIKHFQSLVRAALA